MPSFNTDVFGLGGSIVTATGTVLYVNGQPVFAGSGVSQAQLDLVSGQLIQSGNLLFARDGLISGALDTKIALTGQQAWGAADANGRNLSGNLTQTGIQLQSIVGLTGAALYALITNASGQAVTDYATKPNLALTGSGLYTLMTNMSGQLNTNHATVANLALTGSGLYALITGLSGQAVSTYATIANLAATGQQLGATIALTGSGLYTLITGMSGQANTTYATAANLALTGTQAWSAANNNGINLSGALTQTGIQLQALVALTGSGLYAMITGESGAANVRFAATGAALIQRDLDISGALQALIAGGGSVVKVSGSAAIPTADFTGIGSVSVVYSGGKVFVSGAASAAGSTADAINLSGQLALTGTNLYNLITGASGWLLSQPQVNLAGGTGLLLNTIYYDNITGLRVLTISGAPLDSNAITLFFNVTGITATLGFPTGFRIGSSGPVTGLLFSSGNQAITFTRSNGQWLIDDTSAPLNISTTRPPTVLDSITGGYDIGSRWVNSTNRTLYECVDATPGAAVWSLLNSFSGFSTSTSGQIIFNSGNAGLYGDSNLKWDSITPTLNINQTATLSDNPIAIGGSGINIQLNVQNRSPLISASSDIVATTSVGNDISGYINLGINSPNYSQAAYNITNSGDGYLYTAGGDLVIGTQNPRTVVKFHTTGTTAINLRATIDESGINLNTGMSYRVNNVPLSLSNDMTVCFNTAAVTWASMPNTLNFFNASSIYITYADLSACTGINLVMNKGTVGMAPSGGLMVRYLGNFSATASSYLPITSPEILTCASALTSTVIQSGYRSIVAGARSGVYLALMGISGSGAASPVFNHIMALFK